MTRRTPRRWTAVLAASAFLLLSGTEECEPVGPLADALDLIDPDIPVHPAVRDPLDGDPSDQFRTIDGTGNHYTHYTLGAAHTMLRRALPDAYDDDVSAMAGANRPSAREVSNLVCAEQGRTVNALGASDFLWQWGQFLDHDIDLTVENAPFGPEHIRPDPGDVFFDPNSEGLSQISFHRSQAERGTGIDSMYPRQQVNSITHYIDASNVYGSEDARAAALRTNDGTGRLLVSAGDMLPFNTQGFDNAGGTGSELFFAGDIRANEQVALTAMHTLFVREHNRLAGEIAASVSGLSGDEIYHRARRVVGALMQGITFNEFLPALLGPGVIPDYDKYDQTVSPAIINSFSAAVYRFGHSALSPTLLRLDANGNTIPFGDLPLKDAFFDPTRLTNEGGIEPILRGLAAQEMSAVDVKVIDAVRNFLFGDPTAGGLDLASLNIQRGRDHGLPDYASAHFARGLGRIHTFSDITSDPTVEAQLAAAYGDTTDIDLWVGGLAEDPISGGHVGELFSHMIMVQFEALRDGDRYWYQWDMDPAEMVEIDNTTLADVIRRNTTIDTEISDDVFHVN